MSAYSAYIQTPTTSHWTMPSKTGGKSLSRATVSIFRFTKGIVTCFTSATMSFHRRHRSFERSTSRSQYWFDASIKIFSHSMELQCSIASFHDGRTIAAVVSFLPRHENQSAFSSCSRVARVRGCIGVRLTEILLDSSVLVFLVRGRFHASRKTPVAWLLERQGPPPRC